MGCINIAVKKLPGTVANNIKQNIQRMPKPTTLTIAILNKIQNITVIENFKLDNEEDLAEDITKAIEEAYLFSCYFGIQDSFFFF